MRSLKVSWHWWKEPMQCCELHQYILAARDYKLQVSSMRTEGGAKDIWKLRGILCQQKHCSSSAAIPRWTFRVSSDPRRQASQGPESIDVGDQSRTLCCRRFYFALFYICCSSSVRRGLKSRPQRKFFLLQKGDMKNLGQYPPWHDTQL